jgi:predicted RNase H-like nuclease
MKPINASQRRKAFFSYLIIFLITLLPICFSIYMYGRVDQVENAFLREKYEEKKKQTGEISNERIVYSKLENNALELKRKVTEAADRATKSQQAGNILSKIQEVEGALGEFRNNTYNAGRASATDSALVRILDDQLITLTALNGIYRETFDDLDEKSDNYDDLKEAFDDYKKLRE